MKTKVEYEASDIDMKDKVHAALYAGIVLGLLEMSAMPKEKPADPKESDALVTGAMNRSVAFTLTAIDAAGYVITKREDVPEVYREEKEA